MNATPKSTLPAFFMVAVAPMCWAGNIVLAKGVASNDSSGGTILLAMGRGLSYSAAPDLALRQTGLENGWPDGKSWGLLALFGVTSFNTLLYLAMHTTTAINGALIQTTMPAVIIVISLVLYGERVSRIQAAGVAFVSWVPGWWSSRAAGRH
jgi:drug/metabolite transporter (DMT)-like permease